MKTATYVSLNVLICYWVLGQQHFFGWVAAGGDAWDDTHKKAACKEAAHGLLTPIFFRETGLQMEVIRLF